MVGNDHQYLKTKIYPSNKLAEKRQCFFSTKRKRNLQKKKPVISQSTIEELNKVGMCASCFKEDCPGNDGGLVDWVECSNCAVGYIHYVTMLKTKLTTYVVCVALEEALILIICISIPCACS